LKNFVIIGAAGYIAPRHMKAIKDTGNNLLAALDKHDSVGVMDDYFPEAAFFTEFERFERHCEKLRRNGQPVHYVSVCTPNYLHDAHVRFGLRIGADVICEKPVVLNPWNVDALIETEKETGKKVFNLLQLRQHPAILALKEKVATTPAVKEYSVDLKYITPRGNWYHTSWKGDVFKSGGVATNIGIHFFDMLLWIFGDIKTSSIQQHDKKTVSGKLEFSNARVNWLLSIDSRLLTKANGKYNRSTYRSLIINGEEIKFSDGFEDLHTESYREILSGNGVGLAEAKKVIQLLHDIRNETGWQPGT